MISLYYCGDEKRFSKDSKIDNSEKMPLLYWLFFVVLGIADLIYALIM